MMTSSTAICLFAHNFIKPAVQNKVQIFFCVYATPSSHNNISTIHANSEDMTENEAGTTH